MCTTIHPQYSQTTSRKSEGGRFADEDNRKISVMFSDAVVSVRKRWASPAVDLVDFQAHANLHCSVYTDSR